MQTTPGAEPTSSGAVALNCGLPEMHRLRAKSGARGLDALYNPKTQKRLWVEFTFRLYFAFYPE